MNVLFGVVRFTVKGIVVLSTPFVGVTALGMALPPDRLEHHKSVTLSEIEERRQKGLQVDTHDVVVAGFGLAGGSAALEAAAVNNGESGSILLLDRFRGGGASKLSGGILYLGGGTALQQALGVNDTPADMLQYLRKETDNAVPDNVVRDFVASSVDNFEWISSLGIEWGKKLSDQKTSYPSTDDVGLYYSGNEKNEFFAEVASPAARGHRPAAKGMSGRVIMEAVAKKVESEPQIRFDSFTRVGQLIVSDEHPHECVGAVVSQVPAFASFLVNGLERFASFALSTTMPKFTTGLSRLSAAIERSTATERAVLARGGVIIASGGFMFSREYTERYLDPAVHRSAWPLIGTIGDQGDALSLGAQVGAATRFLDRSSMWVFLYPPAGLTRGVLVNSRGERLCDESLYGAAVSNIVFKQPDQRAFLIYDRSVHDQVSTEAKGRTSELRGFQKQSAKGFLKRSNVSPDLDALAEKIGVRRDTLKRTIDTYNTDERDRFGKPAEYRQPLLQSPFFALDLSPPPTGSSLTPRPTMTLGGLLTDERGQVISRGGGPISGLFAAGRASVGLCSKNYVSGLSLADCVFGGRRAGRNAAQRARDFSPLHKS